MDRDKITRGVTSLLPVWRGTRDRPQGRPLKQPQYIFTESTEATGPCEILLAGNLVMMLFRS